MGESKNQRFKSNCSTVANRLNKVHTQRYPAANRYAHNWARSLSGLFRITLRYRNTAGVAEGSIMPTIITVHMRKSKNWWVTSQRRVIIQAEDPVIVPYISTAIGPIHAQHNAVRTSNATPTIQRSRNNSFSKGVSVFIGHAKFSAGQEFPSAAQHSCFFGHTASDALSEPRPSCSSESGPDAHEIPQKRARSARLLWIFRSRPRSP